MIKSVKVKYLLLGPKYSPNNKDYGNYLFGDIFQARLRREVHKTKSEYKCPYCNGTGIILTFAPNSSYHTLDNLLDDLSLFTEYKVTDAVIDILNKLGISDFNPEKKKGGLKSAATPVYEVWLSNLKKMRDLVNKRAKELKRINTDEEQMKVSNDPKRLKLLKQTGLNIKNSIVDSKKNSLVAPCGVCLGNGYYDVGHIDIFGKQVEMMNYVYQKYIANGKNQWEKRISVDSLYKEFKKLRFRPEIPNILNEFVDPIPIIDKKINRWNLYTDQNKAAKAELYKQYEQIYLGNKSSITSDITFEDVIDFFRALINTSRVDTGTLKEYLTQELEEIKTSRILTRQKLNIQEDRTPYVGKYLFIEGPVAAKANPRRKTHSALYVYGARFVPNIFSGGHAKPGVDWGKSTSLSSIIPSKLRKNRFLIFFPQRLKQYETR